MTNPEILYPIAWSVTLACVFISAAFALISLRNHPRLFTVMALLTCTWMLVLGAYGAPEERKLSDLVSDIAAFLLVYIGGLLVLESRTDEPGGTSSVSALQTTAISVLLFIAVPRALEFPGPMAQVTKHFFDATGLTVDQTKQLVSFGLTIVAFLSLAQGVHSICDGTIYRVFVGILCFYAALELGRTIDIWIKYRPMGPGFVYGFALAKVATTVTLGIIVVQWAKRHEPVTSPALKAA